MNGSVDVAISVDFGARRDKASDFRGAALQGGPQQLRRTRGERAGGGELGGRAGGQREALLTRTFSAPVAIARCWTGEMAMACFKT